MSRKAFLAPSGVTNPRRRAVRAVTTTSTALFVFIIAVIAIRASSPPNHPHLMANEPATAMNLTQGPANNSPQLVADPTDRRFVVIAHRRDSPDFRCALQVSGDGGRSWLPGLPVPDLPTGADKCYAPEAAFDGAGTLYFLFVGLAGNGNQPMGAFLTTSKDRGLTFSQPHQILGRANFGVHFAIDRDWGRLGRIHLVWLHAAEPPVLGGYSQSANFVLAAYSDDGGATFSPPTQVSDAGRRLVVAPALALGPNHGVNVAYFDLGRDERDYQGLEGPTWDGTWSLVVAASADGGRHLARGGSSTTAWCLQGG